MTCWPRINGKQSCCCGTASVALGAIKGSPSRRKERKGVKAVSAKRQTAKESMRVEEIFDRVVARFIGTKHERDIKRIMPLVAAINALEPEMQRLSDAEMLAKTQELKAQVAERLGDAQSDDPHYKEQLEAALERALGLTVGVIVHDLEDTQRRAAYAADITYGTNNEFGFDYLRDNMKYDLVDCVQRGHQFAIVDEVDSILIDEARTPLIISGPAEESTDLYYRIDRIIPKLTRAATIVEGKLSEIEESAEGDYIVDEKAKAVSLTEQGVAHCEKLLGVENLYDPKHIDALHHIQQGLRAHALFRRDVDYVVKEGEVIIVDEFTGRMMPGRRWSDGLHQAVEAKENVRIERENQTLATITFQNYFRMYEKLAGM